MRADHYRIVHPGTNELLRRPFKTLKVARSQAVGCSRVAAMNQAGKVLRYLPVNPKGER